MNAFSGKMWQCLFLILLFPAGLFGQSAAKQSLLFHHIDSVLTAETTQPFNGIVLVASGKKALYSKVMGLSNRETETPLTIDDQFVIGSVSKQITAVIVLREYDRGRLRLHVPIRTYLPDLERSWADTVTVHQLLTHTHGIKKLNEPLGFVPGTAYSYSQIGFELLAQITEKTSGQSFAELSAGLFRKCKMKRSFHPELKLHDRLATSYSMQENGNLAVETESLEHYVAAGAFISTAGDLLLWNKALFGGKLLSKESFRLMTTEQENAIRQHPMFGTTYYGYGTTVDRKEALLQWGQTGFAPGFVSMNFYFPETKTSVIILENIVYDQENLNKAFAYHMKIWQMVRKSLAEE